MKNQPLGIIPRWLHNETRLTELCSAVQRYNEAKVRVPKQWYDEIRDHLALLKQQGTYEEYLKQSPETQIKNLEAALEQSDRIIMSNS